MVKQAWIQGPQMQVQVCAGVRGLLAAETLASYGGQAWHDVVAVREGCGARTPFSLGFAEA
ncbi:hypothetical protein PVK06_046238 [Gossypium arboreum]|uniref:Uncharacterized protein n=1 Tax=Gossypium arboreum TaxID=29729 RepID=A0ABR0MAF7_GOSAR|nr:hypothetical protein PVK06_046238 [Gossypium arboreum]